MDLLPLLERFGLPLVMLFGLVYMTFLKPILIPGWYLKQAEAVAVKTIADMQQRHAEEIARERADHERERLRADTATTKLWEMIATSRGLVSIAQEASQGVPRG